jgi:hypothetical protein
MRVIIRLAIVICVCACCYSARQSSATPLPRTAAGGPTILKRTIEISAYRFLRYWPNPKAAEPQYNTWSWVPRVSFTLLGPVPGGSQWYVDFQTPDGKPWISYKCPTEEFGDDIQGEVKTPTSDDDEKKAITQTGLFPFKIHLKNALAGTDTVMFEGKARIGTYAPDQNIPEYKGKREFYVEQDWRLPMGIIWLNPTIDANVPTLSFSLWFKGVNGAKLEAFLIHNGQPVDTVEGYGSNAEGEIKTGVGDSQGSWDRCTFTFAKVRGFNKDTSANSYASMYFLDKNPGDYEIRVLRDGKLARVAKFTVGGDGWPSDNGIATNNKMGGIRKVLGVQIVGDQDKGYNPQSWKTDMLYGNPLAGFTAP